MADNEGRYYWIKLRTDFFADDSPMDTLLGFPNGSEYVCLYLKLCLMTANKGGRLCNAIGEMLIPYNVEKIAKDMKYFSIDTVRVALELYAKMGLIYEEGDGILVIADSMNMVGSESSKKDAIRQRRHRLMLKEKSRDTDVTESVTICHTDIRDIEIRDKDIREEDIREEREEKDIALIHRIVDYLNDTCGTHYQAKANETKRLIRARLKDGFTEEDFQTVISRMNTAWGRNPKMKPYLRPLTLFGTKFESYLNRPDGCDEDSDERKSVADMDWDSI